ncbi:transcription factor p65-like [Euwallacea fornicatus]|uniref:transcription factor p65-like n=1 Tax=Euwallacea fornicatus TaxID=995702 RepID=UPI00338D579C
MALRFTIAFIAVVVAQVNAGCILTPPPPPCPIPGLNLKNALYNVPTSFICPPVKTKLTQHPDINIPLALPDEIPLGNYCSCQKYGITPSLVPCSPASAPAPSTVYVNAPAPAPLPSTVYVNAPAPAPALSSCVLNSILSRVPVPVRSCGCV